MVAFHVVGVVGFTLTRPRKIERTTSRSSFLESLSLVRHDRALIVFLAVAAAVAVAIDPINTLTPAFAKVFGHRDTFSGALIGVFGAGAVTAGLVLSGRTFGSRRAVACMVAIAGGGHILFSVTPFLPLALVFLFASGFGLLASVSVASAQLQLRVEDAVRGRIMALFGIAYLGLRPFASLIDGAIASGPGVRVAGALLPLPALVLAAALAWTILVRRREPSPVA
jgi:predicted MFS family arabinose efflux permease